MDKNNPENREVGTDSLTRIYNDDTPSRIDTIKRIVREKKNAHKTSS